MAQSPVPPATAPAPAPAPAAILVLGPVDRFAATIANRLLILPHGWQPAGTALSLAAKVKVIMFLAIAILLVVIAMILAAVTKSPALSCLTDVTRGFPAVSYFFLDKYGRPVAALSVVCVAAYCMQLWNITERPAQHLMWTVRAMFIAMTLMAVCWAAMHAFQSSAFYANCADCKSRGVLQPDTSCPADEPSWGPYWHPFFAGMAVFGACLLGFAALAAHSPYLQAAQLQNAAQGGVGPGWRYYVRSLPMLTTVLYLIFVIFHGIEYFCAIQLRSAIWEYSAIICVVIMLVRVPLVYTRTDPLRVLPYSVGFPSSTQ